MIEKKLQEVIVSSLAVVHRGRYAYLKLSPHQEVNSGQHFLVCKDNDEITVITEEKNVASVQHEQKVEWFTLIEIKVSLPFLAKGFLASIAKAVADKGLNLLVVSTFSKDYLLVREETSEQAISALKELGFPVIVNT